MGSLSGAREIMYHVQMSPTGFPLILSAPSGTGKSTVCRRLLGRDRSLRYSVSCTTRPPRQGERRGRDYHFLGVEEFRRRARRGDFLEWAGVHGHCYGTPRRFLEQQVEAGRVVILAIDVQGARAVRRRRGDAVTVFLLPPSWRSLEQRLERRRADPSDAVARRLRHAPEELRRAKEYDYLVVNDALERAVRQIESIIAAEKLRASRQDLGALGIAPFKRRRAARSIR